MASDIFGDTDPQKMPRHFFHGVVHLDFATAIRAHIAAQYYSVSPRLIEIVDPDNLSETRDLFRGNSASGRCPLHSD